MTTTTTPATTGKRGHGPGPEAAAEHWWSRREDVRLLTGTASFVGDVSREGQLFLRVVRSSVAHGELRAVDVEAAAAAAGVVRVLTAADLPTVPRIPLRILTRPELAQFLQPVLAVDRVRYVGEPVAVVIARSAALAEDAAELVEVDIVPLPPAVDVSGAREALVWPHTPDDVMCRFVGRDGDAARALETADVVVTQEVSTGRDTGLPLETRGLVAEWEGDGQVLHLWGPTKFVKFTRQTVSSWFDLEPEQVVCHHIDVGGMFGPRGEVYPEDFLVPWAASVVQAPVKWVEDLNEHLMAINHARGQTHRVTVGAKASGELVALQVESVVDYGAYARPIGGRLAELVVEGLPGPYRWGSLDLVCSGISTNKTPTGTMRGPSTFDTTFARERALDVLADRLGRDPLDLRRQNLITAAELPYRQGFSGQGFSGQGASASGSPGAFVHDATYDSGDYHEVLDRLLAAVGFSDMQEQVRLRRAAGELVGYGVACFLDHSGLGREETIRLDLLPEGRFRYVTTGSEIGQGLASMVAKVGAESLQVSEDRIDVVTNDTTEFGAGNGTFASRSTIFVGSAAMDAALQLREAVLAEAGAVAARDGDGTAPDWAACAPRTVIGRHESATPTFGFGMHLALVAVDPDTADVAVERLAVAYDCGRAIDMDSVRGQLVGAAVQGLGGTLLQELSFDAGGQPQSTTFMDFLVPTLSETPRVETVVVELPGTVSNPLGVKGAGEAGIMGVGGAVSNAVSAALGVPGAVTRLPVHPDALLPYLAERPAPPARAAASPPAAAEDLTTVSSLRHRTRVIVALGCGAGLCALAAVRLLRRASHRNHG